jgi:hypothetical protein
MTDWVPVLKTLTFIMWYARLRFWGIDADLAALWER